MKDIRMLAFDLSSACVGVIAAEVDCKYNPLVVKSCPIIPPSFDASTLGYKKTKRKVKTKSGENLVSYIKDGELTVSKTEKKRRDKEVRDAKNRYVLNYIGSAISEIVNTINPNIIFVEKNEIFNGILTSVLLSEVMGMLTGISAANSIPLKQIKVKTARSILDTNNAIKNLVSELTEDEIKKIPDVTKRALRKLMEQKYGKYGLECSTDDESDACVILNYCLEKIKSGEFELCLKK